jgi:hypothetical protein
MAGRNGLTRGRDKAVRAYDLTQSVKVKNRKLASIRMITETGNSGFAARDTEQMGSDTCSASRTTGTCFPPNAW